MTSSIQQTPFDERIATLLSSNALPTEDLSSAANVTLFSHTRDNHLCGVVGLELHGSCALLRSLAVSPEDRGKGIGEALVAYAEHAAAARDVADLYLLTTTAQPYFEKLGYSMAERATAPAAITQTTQFAGLCPASAAFMVKRLPS